MDIKPDRKNALHTVSAWSCQHQLVLGQTAVDAKTNEITAIPELLSLLDIENSIITLDAMGCQKEIAKQIIQQKADYILALKGIIQACKLSWKLGGINFNEKV